MGTIGRFLAALILVYATYNPEGISYYHWAIASLNQSHVEALSTQGAAAFHPLKIFSGIVLIIGWVTFIIATKRSLGAFGVMLTAAFFGSLMWVLTAYNIIPADNVRLIHHVVLVMIAGLLTVGLSWSLVTRQVTGQVDTDSVD